MKKMHHLTQATAALFAACLVSTATADESGQGWYFNLDVGPNVAQDVDVRIGGLTGTLEMDLGFRAGVGLGYQLNRNLALQLDTGYLRNEVKDSNGSSLAQVPFIANAVYSFHNSTKFVPYIGGGLGGSWSMVDVDDLGVNDSDGDFVFAWQATTGVNYNINENTSVGVFYKYLGTTDGSYDILGVNFDVEKVHNHSFGIGFSMRF